MEPTPAELSRERAVSSEPCSTRPNPFEEPSSRKRQRVSREESRSRSVDTVCESDSAPPVPSTPLREGNTKAGVDSAPPRTPTRTSSDHPPPEPTSSRVTINLRTAHPLESIPSSPPSPTTPSKMANNGEDADPRVSIESESDALSTAPAIGTPSSSPSALGGSPAPDIEIIPLSEDDGDFEGRGPPVAILDGDTVLADPVLDFPFLESGEPLPNAVRRVANFLQYDDVAGDDVFCKLRDWMSNFMRYETDSFPLYRHFCNYRDFWYAFPDLFWALNSRRSRFFGDFLRRHQHSRQALSDMFCQFARLAGRFVAMDVKTLTHPKADMGQDPDLGSRRILEAFSFLLRKEETTHIGRNLETHYNWNWDDDAADMISQFLAEGGSIPNLTKLVGAQLAIVPRNPKIIENLVEPCRLVCKAILTAAHLLESSPLREFGENAKQEISEGYDFFKVMAFGLETIIDKHVTFLTPDAAQVHLQSLYELLEKALKYENDETRELLDKRRLDHPDIQRKNMSLVFSHQWRFSILKKLITSAQMQLRVVGATTMCGDLLRLYNLARGTDPPRSPVLLFLAHFVLDNKLIEYLVGIGSHPEIINESHNILGFLIVTKTYTSELTDLIWQTVTTSQDPRVVKAILLMIRHCMNLYDYTALLYICEKACDLPIEAFNAPMREFCEALFLQLVTKAVHDNVRCVDAPPYELCVRLIRESSIITPGLPAGYPDIQNFAAFKLRELLSQGPEPGIREEIYASCIEEISSRRPTAPGSICVLSTLIKHHLNTDLRTLTTQSGLTRILVEELEYTIAGERDSSVRNTPASAARRDLILLVIVHHPETISPDLGRRLWDHLVGSESKNMAERADWWNIINAAVKRSPHNPYLVACFKEHLPNLPPHCFTPGALEFARSANRSWLETVGGDFPIDDDRAFETPSLEQIWRMILTAPPNTIDAAAIGILVEVYVDSVLITSMPRTTARSIHLVLVERCLKQLSGAASRLKSFSDGATSEQEDGMVIVPSEAQFQEQETIFARSLAVLREFLKAYQSKPRFVTPKPKLPTAMASGKVEGEEITVKYQSFDGNTHTEVRSLTIGKLNTAAALFASLQKATGFRNYKVFCQGREFDPDEVESGKSLEDLNLTGLVLVQRREGERPARSSEINKTTLELEIMKHFEELWSYLSMQEKVAQEIYHFLIKFPVYDRILKEFDDEAIPYTQIFPQGQPFRCLYAIHTLREYIAGQSQKGSVNEVALTRAIGLIVAAISDEKVLDNCTNVELKDRLALHLIDCFIQFLKEPLLPSSVAPHLNDILLSRLLTLLDEARSSSNTPQSLNLTCRLSEALLEASLHNSAFWDSLVIHLKNGTLFHDLVLGDSRPVIRKSFTKQMMNKCTFSPSLAQVSTTSFLMEFWPMVATLIPEAVNNPRQCEETFLLAHALFKRLADTSVDSLRLGDLVKEWGTLLLRHKCIENVGHPESIDMVAHGLANLICCAASFAKASQQSLSSGAIGCQLFRKHLFPNTHIGPQVDETIVPNIPLLNTLTRQTMSDAVFLLVKDDAQQFQNLLGFLLELVSYEDNVPDGPYSYELNWLHDRSKSIRSPTGYVGLRNLSNTCYLNSLFTQLFMNIPFREFMLQASVADGGASQKLLSETQILFANMQNSLARSADPQNLANSIRTYEETPIDVSIQMDVDEFYNLLFDRWESQILAPEAKKQFRSFYGGQLVQQVKSKECPHISERLEIFSAIQCDIKGKSSLQESLQAYVDGEVMEGDNKYKCSTCDRHVDAVKRACLKEIPDNLIFHLKRFDFNLRTLQRSKINDHFSFPNKIDMRPYKVEHLMDNPEQTSEDVFELVGILVHAGTAESGHYYSFIRERPSTSDKDNWVEFNDDSVTPWDPNNMENATFGGIDYRGQLDNGNMTYDKSYSAYMLFYQRSSTLAAQKHSLEVSGESSPVRLSIPPMLSNHIAQENEFLMRKYALYDSSHLTFVLKMLGNVKKITGGRCSQSHVLEKTALNVVLHHLDQVVTRTKELPDFVSYMGVIRQTCQTCAECTRDYLEWYCNYPEILRQLLFKNNDSIVRNEIGTSIHTALQRVKADLPYAYGLRLNTDPIDLEDEEEIDGDPQLLQSIVKGLNKLWDAFHLNCRAWPEYFGLLGNIASMGQAEAVILLDAGYLRRTLEVVSADQMLPLTPQLNRMLNIVNKRLNSRPVSYDSVISLLYKLLRACDPSEEAVPDNMLRFDINRLDAAPPLTQCERDSLTQHWTRTNAHILVEKLLQINQNPRITREIIIALIRWPEDDLDPCIFAAISLGIRKGSANVEPFLSAALLYCEHTESANIIPLIELVVKATKQLDILEGRDFLQFFTDVVKISPTNRRVTSAHIVSLCLELIGDWAPRLLTYYDGHVRDNTVKFLTELLSLHWDNGDFSKSIESGTNGENVHLAGQKLGFACLAYLDHTYVRTTKQAVRPTVQEIQDVIENCETFFETEKDGALQSQYQEKKTHVLRKLKDYTIDEEADDEGSEWAGSDDEYGSSEPMGESIAELCNPLIDAVDQL